MFEPGVILYFDPFYFKNGNSAKPKYFVVLKTIDNLNLLASLPTRTDSIPNHLDNITHHGCIESEKDYFNCYVINKDIPVTECEKSFDFNTHLYGEQLDDYNTELLKEIYPNEGVDFFVWGKLKKSIYEQILNCFKNSTRVKRKYKRLL